MECAGRFNAEIAEHAEGGGGLADFGFRIERRTANGNGFEARSLGCARDDRARGPARQRRVNFVCDYAVAVGGKIGRDGGDGMVLEEQGTPFREEWSMKVAGLTVLALVAFAATAFAYEPTSNYTIQDIEGWKVYVNNGLLGEGRGAEVGAEALKKLKSDLATMKKWIPEGPLKELVKVPIWLEVDTTNGPHGKTPVFHYHPYKEWLEEMDFNPGKHKCVEFSRAADYVAKGDRSVRTVLHELAHAYHDRVLGFDDPEILAAYKRAVEGTAYPRRDWARIDEKEFFCAVTERYFGSEKERAQLKERDPDVVNLLKRVWGEPRAVPEAPAVKPDTERRETEAEESGKDSAR